MDAPLYHLAQNIEFLRKRRNLSLDDIRKATSIPKSTVSSYAEGRAKNPSEANIKKLADFFKMTPEDLMFKNLERTLKLPIGNKNPAHASHNQNGTHTLVKEENSLHMNEMISLPLIELLKLQQVTDDSEMTKAISQVIQLKQRIEYLEKENKELQNDKEFLTELLKQKK